MRSDRVNGHEISGRIQILGASANRVNPENLGDLVVPVVLDLLGRVPGAPVTPMALAEPVIPVAPADLDLPDRVPEALVTPIAPADPVIPVVPADPGLLDRVPGARVTPMAPAVVPVVAVLVEGRVVVAKDKS
jgi:hypothetical protein